MLHQLAVTGKAWADVAVLIGGQDFRIYRIERDDEKVSALIEREVLFWQKVMTDTAPDSDGSESSGNALTWMYPRDTGETLDCTGSATLNTLFAELLTFKRQRTQLEFLEATHRQSIQAAMGNAAIAIFVGGRVSWKKARDSVSTDVKRLLQDYPDLASQYETVVPGSRRFLMQVDKRTTTNAEAP